MNKINAFISIIIFCSVYLTHPAIPAEQKREDPILTAIKRLQPALKDRKANKLAAIFRKVTRSRTCNMPWQILVSIAYNESSLGTQLINSKSKDYGLMQINQRNLRKHKLKKRHALRNHLRVVQVACSILEYNKSRYKHRVPYWLGIYRSGTALWKPSIRNNARAYDRIIRRTAKLIGYRKPTRVASN